MTATMVKGTSTARRPHTSMHSRRLRVLYMIDRAGALGGAERFVVGLAAHVPRERIEAWVCSTRGGNDGAVKELADAGVPHVSLERRSTWQLHRLGPLAALIRRGRFDVLHAHKFGSNLWGTLLGRSCRVPVVIAHEHNWSYTDDPVRAWIDGQIIGRLATRFIAVSTAGGERMMTVEHVARRKVVVMPTAYVPHAGSPQSELRAELGLGAQVPIVGAVAGLRPEKGLDALIDAFFRLLERVPGMHLVIAGEGPCRAGLERQIAELGLGAKVHLLGWRTDVDAILRDIDVGVISSDWEGMPLFVFECMAAGTPLVATAVGGVTEVVTDDETGLLIPPRDSAVLANAIERVLTDSRLGTRLAVNAAARLDRFKIDCVARRFADLYEELAVEAGALVGSA